MNSTLSAFKGSELFVNKTATKSVNKINYINDKSIAASKEGKFVIEKLKWSWAENVKSKNIYRDEEFVKTNTKKEAIQAIDFLLNQPKGLTYTITVERDKKFYTYFRHSMPCLGGLVKYADSHGAEHHWMNPYFPRDIYVAFPEGKITFIACHRPNILKDIESEYWQFVFSSESPWVSAFNDKKSIIFKNNYFILTDMKTDPTVFYSLMRLGGLAGGYGGVVVKNCSPKVNILLNKMSHADPRRLAGQLPIRISGGTWADGFGYTRPYNESIFKTSLPTKFNDFRKLAGYPQAEYNPNYFINTTKEKFGMNQIPNVNNVDEKSHDILLKAWDFFAEESKKMGDGFPN